MISLQMTKCLLQGDFFILIIIITFSFRETRTLNYLCRKEIHLFKQNKKHMKKNLFTILLLAVITMPIMAQRPVKRASSTVKKTVTTVKKKVPAVLPIIVKGSTQGINDGEKVYVAIFQNRKMNNLDSATIKGGKFEMKNIKVSAPIMGYLTIGKEEEMVFDPIYLDAKVITVNKKGKESSNADITGSPANVAESAMNKELQPFNKQINDLRQEYMAKTTTAERKKAIEKQFDGIEEQTKVVQKKFMEENLSNLLGINILSQSYYAMDPEEVQADINKLSPQFKNGEITQRMKEWVVRQRTTKIGNQFTDFAMKTPEGKDMKLSDFAGKAKLLLVDFWASWCGPCRAEMPNVVNAYNAYKDKGFEIVGVSLDNNGEAWKKAISDLKITWPQMSDLKGWQSKGAEIYGISAIPATVLIGQDGKIIAKNLRGEELNNKIAEMLK
jgi:peroxiredoxin